MMQLLLLTALAAAPKYPAAKDQFVNDFAEILSAKDLNRIRATAQATLNERGVPIVVATLSSLKAYDAADWTIERYATNLYNEWGIGDKTTNRGVLLLVSVKDRKLRIATGSGLGNFDDRARQVIDGVIVPRFKTGNMPGGIVAGVEAIAKWFEPARAPITAEAEPAAGLPPERIPAGEGAAWKPHGVNVVRNVGGGGCSIFFILIVVFIVVMAARSIFGGGRGGGYGGYGGGGGGGGGGWGRFLMGGLAGFLGSQLLQGGKRHRQWGGGDLFGGGSGGSSFGGGSGFGGGGSSFGGGFSSGGGASGSW